MRPVVRHGGGFITKTVIYSNRWNGPFHLLLLKEDGGRAAASVAATPARSNRPARRWPTGRRSTMLRTPTSTTTAAWTRTTPSLGRTWTSASIWKASRGGSPVVSQGLRLRDEFVPHDFLHLRDGRVERLHRLGGPVLLPGRAERSHSWGRGCRPRRPRPESAGSSAAGRRAAINCRTCAIRCTRPTPCARAFCVDATGCPHRMVKSLGTATAKAGARRGGGCRRGEEDSGVPADPFDPPVAVPPEKRSSDRMPGACRRERVVR